MVLFGIVLTAEMPQIVYIHYSTPEEAEEAQKKILGKYEQSNKLAKILLQCNMLSAFMSGFALACQQL